uniref:Transmembrane protein n=1 Tax=Medicago truncatula TaxID=3880 RepID=I3T1E5_MEDTR|nr:unknown [Medicago truncatula]
MDDRNMKGEGGEVDIESGLVVTKDDSGNTKQERTLFAKIYCGIVGDSIKVEERNSVLYLKDSNLSGDSVNMVKETNKLLTGQDLVKSVENSPVKEKRKKSSNKKAAKPPRAPRGPSLDAADQKLIREITQLAMLKRARVERMKALKKMKAAKASSSPSSSMFAMVCTVVFCIVILFQGISSFGKSSVTSFQGSPVFAGGAEGDLIAVQLQHQLNQISIQQHAPSSESHKIVRGSYLSRKLR